MINVKSHLRKTKTGRTRVKSHLRMIPSKISSRIEEREHLYKIAGRRSHSTVEKKLKLHRKEKKVVKTFVENAINKDFFWDEKLKREKRPFKIGNTKFIKLIDYREGGRGNRHSSAIVEVNKKLYKITHYNEYGFDEVPLEVEKIWYKWRVIWEEPREVVEP